jgi:hypothetical protein
MKRARVAAISLVDVMYFGRLIMENDPFKARAPATEDRAFRAIFGCSPTVVLAVWNKITENNLIPEDGEMKHLLWTLMYAKQYGKWPTMRMLTNTDSKTLRKWINLFFDAISLLESSIVSSSVSKCDRWIQLTSCKLFVFVDSVGEALFW